MKPLSMFLPAFLLLCPLMAHSEVETKLYCFRSQEGKSINFEFRTYYDSVLKWSGAGVRYSTSKKAISLVHRNTEQEELLYGRPYQYTTTWVELADGALTGEYQMVTQGGRVDAMTYTNYKSGKKYSFDHAFNMEPSLKTECQW
ncbi:hypothetical protein [Pseudomonas sp. TWP3-1]|uniref:hypothetical protein n=1 Tax=Pseudomonas sp. TWP3-1 TaxID=2804631 RepID=UPI003CED22ED